MGGAAGVGSGSSAAGLADGRDSSSAGGDCSGAAADAEGCRAGWGSGGVLASVDWGRCGIRVLELLLLLLLFVLLLGVRPLLRCLGLWGGGICLLARALGDGLASRLGGTWRREAHRGALGDVLRWLWRGRGWAAARRTGDVLGLGRGGCRRLLRQAAAGGLLSPHPVRQPPSQDSQRGHPACRGTEGRVLIM